MTISDIEVKKIAERRSMREARAGVEQRRLAMIETFEVDNPMLTAGLAEYQEATRGSVDRKVRAPANAMERIGALCFIRRRPRGKETGNWRDPHHERAAARFKGLYEACYGSGSGAVDPSREPVDHSRGDSDSSTVALMDMLGELREIEADVTRDTFDRLVALLVLGVPAGEGLHWRARKEAIAQAIADLDQLAEVFGLKWLTKVRRSGTKA